MRSSIDNVRSSTNSKTEGNNMMIIGYDSKKLKDYKGYGIEKIWDITYTGKKVNMQYQVSDNDENAIDYFSTLAEAKHYIDTVLV